MKNSDLCPCFSGKLYSDCCQKYHHGLPAENALVLMRSRYSAYAKGLIDYIVVTTHPRNSSYSLSDNWKKQISEFCHHTKFVGLEIIDFQDGDQEASVTFLARLQQGDRDASFKEKSRFVKEAGRWLYIEGKIIP